jgi:hypothetical protein
MNGIFHEEFDVEVVELAVADGTSEVKSDVVDMAGYDAVTFVVVFGDVDAAAVLTLTPKENTAQSDSSPTPTAITLLEADGTIGSISSGALVMTEDTGNLDNKAVLVTVGGAQLSKRYVFLSITVADESFEIVSITALKHKARSVPVTLSSEVAAYAHGVS